MPRTQQAKRKKNVAEEAADAGNVEGAIKKRGRPPKKSKTAAAAATAAAVEDLSKKDTLVGPDTHSNHPHSHAPNTLEKGHISFFYRPKVELEDASNMSEVQKLYLILHPDLEEGKEKRNIRLIVITKKHLPEVDSHERNWGFVDAVSQDMEEIHKKLAASTYETKTLGTRHQHEAKPCGHGVYSIVHHPAERKASDHTHLAYVLELPEAPGELQNEFNIQKEASFIITAKNPHVANHGAVGLQDEERAHYPKKIQEEFHDKRFIPVDDVKLLDYHGAELIFIGVAKEHDVSHELGACAKEMEKTAKEEIKEEHQHPEKFLDPVLFTEAADGKAPEAIITETWHQQGK